MIVRADPETYSDEHRAMLRDSHYIGRPPPGCLFCLSVRSEAEGLAGVLVGVWPLLGVCLVGRPVARMLPQDGSVGEITRMVLLDGLPYGTASAVLRRAAEVARARGMVALIAYHDRNRHTGCIYRKAGFRKDGATTPPTGSGWASRSGRRGQEQQATPKRRWRLDL